MSESTSSINKVVGPLMLSDFKLSQAYLELRTSPKYLHWDRAGSLWTQMIHKIPRLTFEHAEPNKTTFSLDRKYVFSTYLETTGSTPHTSVIGTAHDPQKSLQEFSEMMKIFVDVAREHLAIDDYTRIGLRAIYHKRYPDKEKASQALLSTGLFRVPEGKYFGVEGAPTLPECSVRWEDGKKGVSIRLRVESFKYELTPPIEWRDIDAITKQNDRLAYDLDYYTIGSVATGQFDVIEWIKQAVHQINRDADKFVRGA